MKYFNDNRIALVLTLYVCAANRFFSDDLATRATYFFYSIGVSMMVMNVGGLLYYTTDENFNVIKTCNLNQEFLNNTIYGFLFSKVIIIALHFRIVKYFPKV